MTLFTRRKTKSVTPATWGLASARHSTRQESYLLAIALATVVLWQLPFGQTLLYPFTLLAIWFHEMGHGLASMLLGARFEQLVLFAEGSGYAQSSWPADTPGLFHALTAAAGLLGPSLVGAALIMASRTSRATRVALWLLGLALVLSTVIWVRSLAGWIVLPTFAMAVLAIAARGSPGLQRLSVEFLGVQAAISIWRDIHYLFSDGGYVDGQPVVSDTGAIADILLLPYWFWGGLITMTIAAILWGALRYAAAR